MRHDWNSLLTNKNSHDVELRFTSYSNEIFPNASILAQYIEDFAELYNINVKTNTNIQNINCIESDHSNCDSNHESNKKFYFEAYNKKQKYCNKWFLEDQYANKYTCKLENFLIL